ncbi:MAG: beta-ketoacyl-[acyl-carrier-protein] synthase family protein, partial [Cytophagales bacterium]|nr:beta-ketoacyl-[acyl-carrier-protein] synthase family protein [Cytophagales bacterium]
MSTRVFVTGIGMVSAIGQNVSETLDSIFSLHHGVGRTKFVNTIHKDELPFAEIKLSNEEIANTLGITDLDAYTRTALIGMLAAKEAKDSSSWSQMPGVRSGTISGSTVGGMTRTENDYFQMLSDEKKLHWVHLHDCGDSTEKIAEFVGATDYISTISTACSSSANTILLGARMIKV